MKYAALIASLLIVGPALAQDTPTAQMAPSPANPCSRQQQTVHIAGLDTDMARCQAEVSQEIIIQQSMRLIAEEAQVRMLGADLAAAKEQIAQMQKNAAAAETAKPSPTPVAPTSAPAKK